ncbi:Non-specific lipid-transfer protein [Camellia lanceoleosa]|uniref:Non-specific lipid-transfer protein n=1 Tax=Camellia lanceoleosa TaxID=1840588 RepID=A0ACC0HQB9_9ERIC|nr:Non-specific lipid-transfer protein [Camellia lanceoleosa]
MVKSSELKSEVLEQMKLHLSSDVGKHLTKKIGLVYQLNIAPKKIGFNEDIFVVDLKKGEVKKGPYEDEKPDAIFSFTDEDFFKIAFSKMNPLIVFMRGAMKVESSLSAAQKFTPDIFPKPSKICSVYVASQIASQKDNRSLPANGQSFAIQKDDFSKESLDDESLETTVLRMMHPRCELCYRWLRGLPINYSRRPYSTSPINMKQRPFFARPLASQIGFQKDTRSSTANGQSFAVKKNDFIEKTLDDGSLETAVMQRMCFICGFSYEWLRGLMSSWVPGVPNWFVWQNKFKEMPAQRSVFGDNGIMIKPLLVALNNLVLLEHLKTKELDMVPVTSIKTQRRKIQRKYTQYQRDMKESGESSLLAQSKGQAEEKENPKLASQIKRSASREQLAKVHAELRTKESTSLAGLNEALMESEDDRELGQKKVLVEEDMLEAFTVEQTFLGGKPTEAIVLKELASIEVPECSMEKASQASDQT